jgi:hypothetical protein
LILLKTCRPAMGSSPRASVESREREHTPQVARARSSQRRRRHSSSTQANKASTTAGSTLSADAITRSSGPIEPLPWPLVRFACRADRYVLTNVCGQPALPSDAAKRPIPAQPLLRGCRLAPAPSRAMAVCSHDGSCSRFSALREWDHVVSHLCPFLTRRRRPRRKGCRWSPRAGQPG